MLDPMEETSTLEPESRSRVLQAESLTEDYGESNQSSRTLGGDIDFFSSIGTERKRGKPAEAPKVLFGHSYICTC